MSSKKNVPWDNDIPDRITIPGRSPNHKEPQGENLVLERVPGAKYALYKVEYKRSRLFPRESQDVQSSVKIEP
jgi:hypothetical protein